MPAHIKIGLSALVLLVALAAHVWRDAIGLPVSAPFLAVYAVFLVVALWIFPEPRKAKLPQR